MIDIEKFSNKGCQIIENIYSNNEIVSILDYIERHSLGQKFGIRKFLYNNPELRKMVFSKNLIQIIHSIAPNCNRSIKSIYFDKPPKTNWFVNWHQDLTINLKEKIETTNFKNWRSNSIRTIVQPPISILENIFTIRIHLDNCTVNNGALRVIENSHKKGVIDIKNWMKSKDGIETICEINKGGILIMRPLILHSSKRTKNDSNRRIIHIEFSDKNLANGLKWDEEILLNELACA